MGFSRKLKFKKKIGPFVSFNPRDIKLVMHSYANSLRTWDQCYKTL